MVRLGSFAAHKVTQGAEDASSKPQSCEHAPNGRPFCIWLQRVDPPGRARQKVGGPIGADRDRSLVLSCICFQQGRPLSGRMPARRLMTPLQFRHIVIAAYSS